MQNIDLSKNLNIRWNPNPSGHLIQNLGLKFPLGKIFHNFRNENVRGSLGDHRTVDIRTRFDLYIKRQFHYSLHVVEFKGLTAFDPHLGHHQDVKVDTPSRPSLLHLGKEMEFKSTSLC